MSKVVIDRSDLLAIFAFEKVPVVLGSWKGAGTTKAQLLKAKRGSHLVYEAEASAIHQQMVGALACATLNTQYETHVATSDGSVTLDFVTPDPILGILFEISTGTNLGSGSVTITRTFTSALGEEIVQSAVVEVEANSKNLIFLFNACGNEKGAGFVLTTPGAAGEAGARGAADRSVVEIPTGWGVTAEALNRNHSSVRGLLANKIAAAVRSIA